MNGKPWTKDEIDILTRMYPDHFAMEIGALLGRNVSSVYFKAKGIGLKSSPDKIRRSGLMGCTHPNSVAAQFRPGHVPYNKGRKMPPEVYAKVSRTMFRPGITPHNHRPVGSERVNVHGYIEVKVAEPNRWKVKHRVVWEKVNGAIPRDYNVQFRNGNPLDCRIENLYLISRQEQMAKENSFYARYPKELQRVIQLKGAINRQIRKIQNNG